MIWVVAGTTEGRELVERLLQEGHRILASVATGYGAKFLQSKTQSWNTVAVQSPKSKVQSPGTGIWPGGRLKLSQGSLSPREMEELIEREKVKLVIDATHPFSVNVSKNVSKAAEAKGVKCIRFERKSLSLSGDEAIKIVDDFEEAVEAALQFDTIFLTVGSKNLEAFARGVQEEKKRLIVRILPQPRALEKCLRLGIAPQDIIAMQGPFSKDLNKEMFKKYGAKVLVTKNSGLAGGTKEKVEAALELNLEVILVERPIYQGEKVSDYEELLGLVKHHCSF